MEDLEKCIPGSKFIFAWCEGRSEYIQNIVDRAQPGSRYRGEWLDVAQRALFSSPWFSLFQGIMRRGQR